MKPEPRPNPLLLVAAALVSLPYFVVIAAILIAVGELINDASGPVDVTVAAVVALFGSSIPAAFLLVERHAIRGRHSGSALAVGGLCLYLAGLGLIGWFAGFLHLVGVLPPDRNWRSGWELLTYSLFLLILVFLGTQNLAWRRRLLGLSNRLDAGE